MHLCDVVTALCFCWPFLLILMSWPLLIPPDSDVAESGIPSSFLRCRHWITENTKASASARLLLVGLLVSDSLSAGFRMLGCSECPPFILVACRRPGLPLASPPSRMAWLVEPGPVCRGPLSQRDRDGGCERVLLLDLSNRRV